MNRKNGPKRKKSAPGPRTVRAWFDTVINPLLAALDTALPLLARRNWTWEFQPPGLERIHRVQAYVNRDNLEHLTQRHENVAQAIAEYNDARDELVQRCKELHRHLIEAPQLEEIYRQIRGPADLNTSGAEVEQIVSSFTKEQILNYLAQHIVNNHGELPYFYAMAPIWNRYREQLLGLLDEPSIRGYSYEVQREGMALISRLESLYQILKEVRQTLAEDHDVPYVEPNPGTAEAPLEFPR